MIAITVYGTRIGGSGDRLTRADIQADTKPETMPDTGEGIEGIDDSITLDTGSRIRVLSESSTYIRGDNGNWYKQEG